MPTHTYTHITASPLYTSTHHTIERLSRSSWQITSPFLSTPIPAKTYAEAKALAAEIDFNALSTKMAETEPVATVEAAEVNPFEAILTEAATITDLGDMQGAYDQAVRECDLCAVMGHLQGRLRDECLGAVEAARAETSDSARVVELAGLISDAPLLTRINAEVVAFYFDNRRYPSSLIMALCDLPDGWLKTALIRWACADQYADTWTARLRLEGAALRHAREVAFMRDCERADREWVEPKKAQEVEEELNFHTANRLTRNLMDMRTQADLDRHALAERAGQADMGGDRAREWGEVWDVADDLASACFHHDGASLDDATWEIDSTEDWDAYKRARKEVKARLRGELAGMMPSLLSPEPEHWIPLQDGRVLIVNWRAGECVAEAISAAVWMDDGGLSLMGSYVLGSGWVSDDRLGEEDVDAEALGVILEAIARAGLAAVA